MKSLIIGLLLIIVICSCVYVSIKFRNNIKEGYINKISQSIVNIQNQTIDSDGNLVNGAKNKLGQGAWYGWQFQIFVYSSPEWNDSDYIFFQIGNKRQMLLTPDKRGVGGLYDVFQDSLIFLSPSRTGYETYPFKIYSTRDIAYINFKLINPLYVNKQEDSTEYIQMCPSWPNDDCELKLGWTTMKLDETKKDIIEETPIFCDGTHECGFNNETTWQPLKYLLGGYTTQPTGEGRGSNIINDRCYTNAYNLKVGDIFDCNNFCNLTQVSTCSNREGQLIPYMLYSPSDSWGGAWSKLCEQPVCDSSNYITISRYQMGTGNNPGPAIVNSDVSAVYMQNLKDKCGIKTTDCDIGLGRYNNPSDTTINDLYADYRDQLFLDLIPRAYTNKGPEERDNYPGFYKYYTSFTSPNGYGKTYYPMSEKVDSNNEKLRVVLPSTAELTLPAKNDRGKYYRFFDREKHQIKVDTDTMSNKVLDWINSVNLSVADTSKQYILTLEGVLNLNEQQLQTMSKSIIDKPFSNIYSNANGELPIYPASWKGCPPGITPQKALTGETDCAELPNSVIHKSWEPTTEGGSIYPGPDGPDGPADPGGKDAPTVAPDAKKEHNKIIDIITKHNKAAIAKKKKNHSGKPAPQSSRPSYKPTGPAGRFDPINPANKPTPTPTPTPTPKPRPGVVPNKVSPTPSHDNYKPIQPDLPIDQILGLSDQEYYLNPKPYVDYTSVSPVDMNNINYGKYDEQKLAASPKIKQQLPGAFFGIIS